MRQYKKISIAKIIIESKYKWYRLQHKLVFLGQMSPKYPVIRESALSIRNRGHAVLRRLGRIPDLYLSHGISSWSPTEPTYRRAPLVGRLRRKGLKTGATSSHLMLRYWRHRSPKPSSKPLCHGSHGDQLPLSPLPRTNELTNGRTDGQTNE